MIMNDYLEYQRSVALEFQAYKNRVRNMIGNHHWGEDGRYKEILLMNYLRRILPNTVSVGTGFVRVDDKLTNQIDIIVLQMICRFYFTKAILLLLHHKMLLLLLK